MLRPAHISLTIRFHSSVSVFRLASNASFRPRTRSFRLEIRRSRKGAEDTFTSYREEQNLNQHAGSIYFNWYIAAFFTPLAQMKALSFSPCKLFFTSLISLHKVFCPSFGLTSKSRYCATSTYPGRPSVSKKSRRWVMAIFPTPRLVLTEEDSLKTHSLGSMCSKTDAGKHTWKSHKTSLRLQLR